MFNPRTATYSRTPLPDLRRASAPMLADEVVKGFSGALHYSHGIGFWFADGVPVARHDGYRTDFRVKAAISAVVAYQAWCVYGPERDPAMHRMLRASATETAVMPYLRNDPRVRVLAREIPVPVVNDLGWTTADERARYDAPMDAFTALRTDADARRWTR